MTTLLLCNFEQSKALRDKGFDWPTRNYFENVKPYVLEKTDVGLANFNCHAFWKYSRPTVALALQWCREVKGVHGWVENVFSGYKPYYRRPDNLYSSPTHNHTTYGDHDEADSALLDEILKVI